MDIKDTLVHYYNKIMPKICENVIKSMQLMSVKTTKPDSTTTTNVFMQSKSCHYLGL